MKTNETKPDVVATFETLVEGAAPVAPRLTRDVVARFSEAIEAGLAELRGVALPPPPRSEAERMADDRLELDTFLNKTRDLGRLVAIDRLFLRMALPFREDDALIDKLTETRRAGLPDPPELSWVVWAARALADGGRLGLLWRSSLDSLAAGLGYRSGFPVFGTYSETSPSYCRNWWTQVARCAKEQPASFRSRICAALAAKLEPLTISVGAGE